jgi:hypothetical protein
MQNWDSSRYGPVLTFEVFYALEMLNVVGDKGHIVREGDGRDNQVEIVQPVAG